MSFRRVRRTFGLAILLLTFTLCRYQPSESERILIIAPHLNDASIPGSGTVAVVYLTVGDCTRSDAPLADFVRDGRRRIADTIAPLEMRGVPRNAIYFLGYPSGRLAAMLDRPGYLVHPAGTERVIVPYPEALSPGSEFRGENLLRDLRRVIKETQPTRILVSGAHTNDDHAAARELLQLAVSP